MRTRDEVLTVDTINDRIRELEAQQAASEPVAWALCDKHGTVVLADTATDYVGKALIEFNRDYPDDSPHTLRPLAFAHPNSAGVTITDAMVEAAAKALFLDDMISHGMTWDDASPRLIKEFKVYARIALAAALADPTTPTRGSDE